MNDSNFDSRILVVGELHQDLFYQTNALSELAGEISSDIAINYQKVSGNSDTLVEDIRKIILRTMNRTSKKYSSSAYIKRGGNGNNSATLLSKIGIPTGLMSVVGKGSDWMFRELDKLGIDTSNIYIKNAPTPISTIIEDPEITKIFVANNLKKDMNFEGIPLPNNIFSNTFLVFITPMDLKYKGILESAIEKNTLTAITLELQKIEKYFDLTNCVSKPSEFLFCNLDDAMMICKSEIKEPMISFEEYKAQSKEENIHKLEWEYHVGRLEKVDNILKKFANVRIYTLGKFGSWVRFEDKQIYRGIIDVPVVNRTGAGDTFAAAFIAKLYESLKNSFEYYKKSTKDKEWLFKVCLLFATAAASSKISTGNAPSREEILEMLKKAPN